MIYFYKETQSLIGGCFLLAASQDFIHSSLTLRCERGSKALFVLNFDIILGLNTKQVNKLQTLFQNIDFLRGSSNMSFALFIQGGSSNVSMALFQQPFS